MTPSRPRESASIIPTMRYRDAPRAIEWLCEAFGFEPHLVVPGEGNTIAHSQLKLGNGMIMLGSMRDDEFGRKMGVPGETGINTQCAYIVVEDPDAHCAQAKAAGAEILMDVADQDHGGRLYSCIDPEGHLWCFGSYDPWTD